MFKLIRRLFALKKRPIPEKIGRNEPCWCGSNKKYKNCHFESDQDESWDHFTSRKDDLSPTHRWLLGKPEELLPPKWKDES
ncbi:SEC-C metal-binding domain-containing protein [Chloroflexota bacterium]